MYDLLLDVSVIVTSIVTHISFADLVHDTEKKKKEIQIFRIDNYCCTGALLLLRRF